MQRRNLTHKLLLVGFLMSSVTGFAQRLIIETPGDGPVARVIYGRVTERAVFVFENEFKLEIDGSARAPRQGEAAANVDPTSPAAKSREVYAPKGEVLTSFALGPAELTACHQGARYKAFLSLAKALKARVNQITIEAGSDADECASRIESSLKSAFPDYSIVSGSGSGEGIRLQMGVAVAASAPAAKDDDEEAARRNAEIVYNSEEEVAKNSRILIGESQVMADSDGYFVAAVEGSGEALVTISVTGRSTVQTSVYPVLLGKEPQPVTRGNGYTVRYAQFGKPGLRVTISETPFLARKLTIDGGGGGGFGFGRQVPGEKKGQRMTASLGVERRELLGDFGVRGSVFYTSAPQTVVPNTVTTKMMGIYDWAFLGEENVLRIGAGSEIFYAQIAKPKSNATGTPQYATIPEQVTSPLVHLSLHTVLFDRVVIAPTYEVTPLYVAGIGYYPSYSPSFEIGMKFMKKWFATFNFGSEVHRYPTITGETKLQLDYYAVSVRRGVL